MAPKKVMKAMKSVSMKAPAMKVAGGRKGTAAPKAMKVMKSGMDKKRATPKAKGQAMPKARAKTKAKAKAKSRNDRIERRGCTGDYISNSASSDEGPDSSSSASSQSDDESTTATAAGSGTNICATAVYHEEAC